MRHLLLFGLALATLAAGCVPFGCGGYTGADDVVYQRGNDQLILCENSGFVAQLATGEIDGYYTPASDGGTGTNGPTGAVAFLLVDHSDGTATTTQLGDGAWSKMDLTATRARSREHPAVHRPRVAELVEHGRKRI